MAGQAAYHLLTQARVTHAPWPVTTVVSCLPVLVLGMGAALAHLQHADAHHASQADHARPRSPDHAADHLDHASTYPNQAAGTARAGRLTDAQTAAARLTSAGQRVSRRTLRAAGLHGSNADLAALARAVSTRPASAADANGPGMTPGGAAGHAQRRPPDDPGPSR